jgi:hypothetical protein
MDGIVAVFLAFALVFAIYSLRPFGGRMFGSSDAAAPESLQRFWDWIDQLQKR